MNISIYGRDAYRFMRLRKRTDIQSLKFDAWKEADDALSESGICRDDVINFGDDEEVTLNGIEVEDGEIWLNVGFVSSEYVKLSDLRFEAEEKQRIHAILAEIQVAAAAAKKAKSKRSSKAIA